MTEQELEEALARLPVLQGQEVSVERSERQSGATAVYSVTWDGAQAVLKLYGEPEDASPLMRAKYRATAEAEALRLFAPGGLAPELIWHGTLPGEGRQQAALISDIKGQPLGTLGTLALSHEQIRSLVSALKEIHGEQSERRLVSSTPRNLDAWWARAHEAYRDLPGAVVNPMPESARDVLDSIVHPIAADAQAHKRFWHSAPLTSVQGSPGLNNVRFGEPRPVFVDWECFGMGDLSLEVATWAGLVELWSGPHARSTFLSEYLSGNEDELLPARIAIYRRFWAFGYVLPLLANVKVGGGLESKALAKDNTATIIKCFAWLMGEYERPSEEIEKVRADLAEWLHVGKG